MTYVERLPQNDWTMPLMIHVAASHENRGRVVLAATSGAPHPVAITAAIALARAFETKVEGLLVACPDMVALTAHPFAREVSHTGRIAPLAAHDVDAHQTAELTRARRVLETAATKAGVQLATNVVRDALAEALARACAVEGPWNIVALAEPVAPADAPRMTQLLGKINGATGLVCCGPGAAVARVAPVVVILKDGDAAPQMLRAAERLALAQSDPTAHRITVLLAAPTVDDTLHLEAHARLLLPSGRTDGGVCVTIAESGPNHGSPAAIAEAVRRLDPAWVIVRATPEARANDIADLLRVLRAPLLLVR